MNVAASGRTWEDASSPAAVRLTREYEQAWEEAERSGAPLDPEEFLAACPAARDIAGARLAILRADLSLRWESGDRAGAGRYLERFPDLTDEACVALIYEEFCLREEEGEAIDPAEYLTRYARLADPLRRVLEIHQLIGSATGSSVTSLPSTSASASPGSSGPAVQPGFPEAGQTIGGFLLVEELGRGAFARVFLARERQLADRLVALKVTRRGSREPQALARLQHTHIVPVHSHRVDQATGLHLLCMPYFGRLTLARLLAEFRRDRAELSGAGLLGALDRLRDPAESAPARSSGRSALASRTHDQAIAWWGARLAEALEHAHDRGVLHRDIKPSNVLILGDGMPMLLDFNLARESVLTEGEPAEQGEATLGGTVDYMAPEHLEALAEGTSERVDGRSDLYGLGILLFESVMGDKPFQPLRKGPSMIDSLLRAAADRKQDPLVLFDDEIGITPPLEAVIRRCLQPLPENRYQTASELAADLRAVADDLPLVHAREPLLSRLGRWFRRNRRRLAAGVAILTAVAAILGIYVNYQLERSDRFKEADQYYQKGVDALDRREFKEAEIWFDNAHGRVRNTKSVALRSLMKWGSILDFGGKLRRKLELLWTSPPLDELDGNIQFKAQLAQKIAKTRAQAQKLLDRSESLRFRLIGMGEDLPGAVRELKDLMAPFYVLTSKQDWNSLDHLWKQLDEDQLVKLRREVNELLFLWVAGIESVLDHADRDPSKARLAGDPQVLSQALDVCDRAITFVELNGPWQSLKALLQARRGDASPPRDDAHGSPELVGEPVHVGRSQSPSECFQWGLLCSMRGHRGRAIEWLNRAAWLDWSNYWYQYYLAYLEDKAGLLDDALGHYSVAAGCNPRSPWVRYSRARLYRTKGKWSMALDEFRLARSMLGDQPESLQVGLELGYLYQALGNFTQARDEYQKVIRHGPTTEFARAARLNLANIAAESGMEDRAVAEYESLLSERPDDRSVRFSRALLSLREGRADEAEADLDTILEQGEEPAWRPEVVATRAVARLLNRRYGGAVEDASLAQKLEPSPAHERLLQRAALAARDYDRLQLDRPEVIRLLPVGGARLESDLRAAEDGLARMADADSPAAYRATLNRVVVLATLGEVEAAMELSDRLLRSSPNSPQVRLICARILHVAGRRDRTMREIQRGLDLRPDEPGLLELRGLLRIEEGRPAEGLVDLGQAVARSSGPLALVYKARALASLGRHEEAISTWTLALRRDPELPQAYLGRARSYVRLRLWDQALADLELASTWSHADTALQWGVVATYAQCLSERLGQAGRWFVLTRRAIQETLALWSQSR